MPRELRVWGRDLERVGLQLDGCDALQGVLGALSLLDVAREALELLTVRGDVFAAQLDDACRTAISFSAYGSDRRVFFWASWRGSVAAMWVFERCTK